jgi:hypothetical protein
MLFVDGGNVSQYRKPSGRTLVTMVIGGQPSPANMLMGLDGETTE